MAWRAAAAFRSGAAGGAPRIAIASRDGALSPAGSLDRKPPGVLFLELEAVPGTAQIRADHAFLGERSPVKQHLLDAHVIMELLEMAHARNCAGNMAMK